MAKALDINGLHRFGAFEVDVARRILRKNGEPVPISDKALELLFVLLQGRDRILDKDELLEAVWPNLVVEPNNLTVAMSGLRKALGEGPSDHRYIVTVPKRGYRFVADLQGSLSEKAPSAQSSVDRVTPDAGSEESTRAKPQRYPLGWVSVVLIVCALALFSVFAWRQRPERAGPSEVKTVQSVAVLPFKVIGANSEGEYLGVGVADALITRLSTLTRLQVRPTASVLRYRSADSNPVEVGRELGVDAILSGVIQQAGQNIRVSVQLTSVATSATTWAESFDQSFTNVLAVEDSISAGATAHLMVELSAQERSRLTRHATEDPEAYQDYMKGRFFWDKDTEEPLRKSIEYFERAIEKDPTFSLAYVGVADAYNELVLQGYMSGTEGFPKAKQAAERALKLDGELAEPHSALAVVQWGYNWDWIAAENEFSRALAIRPDSASIHSSRAFLLMTMRRFDDSIMEAKRAGGLNPTSASVATTVGYAYFAAERFEKSVRSLKQAVDLDPEFAFARALLAVDYALSGDVVNAKKELTFIHGVSRGDADPLVVAMAAYSNALLGDKREALAAIEHLKDLATRRYVDPYAVAIIYAGLGQENDALFWLEKAYQERSLSVVFFNFDPFTKSLRTNPRFVALVERASLPT